MKLKNLLKVGLFLDQTPAITKFQKSLKFETNSLYITLFFCKIKMTTILLIDPSESSWKHTVPYVALDLYALNPACSDIGGAAILLE